MYNKNETFKITVDEKYSVSHIPPSDNGLSNPLIRVFIDNGTVQIKEDLTRDDVRLFSVRLDPKDSNRIFVSSLQKRSLKFTKMPKKVEKAIIEALEIVYGESDYYFATNE